MARIPADSADQFQNKTRQRGIQQTFLKLCIKAEKTIEANYIQRTHKLNIMKLKHDSQGILCHPARQVAQLSQRDRVKLASFLINLQHYSQNHKIACLGHPMGQYKRFI